MRPLLGLFVLLVYSSLLPAQDYRLVSSQSDAEARWVDSVFNRMSPAERLGQLFMVRAHSDLGPDHIEQVRRLIRDYHVGGLCFFQGTPERQVELTNAYQNLSEVPLLVGIDGEWGLGMRMPESTISFPRQLTLGAIQNNRLIYEMGAEVAREMRRVGVNVNFAPVADINNNAANPVINTRSFGEDRYNVTIKSYMYMRGMQDHGLMASAKHFPGHGDTNVDSHNDLPVIRHDIRRLDSVELYPFRALSDYGIGSMMVAHLDVPALDPRPGRPTSLSTRTINGLLKDEFGFQGLVFTDGLEMRGVTKHFEPGVVEAEALAAGADMLLLPLDIAASFREIERYLQQGLLLQSEVDASVKKVLRAKYRLGLPFERRLRESQVREELNTPEAKSLRRKLIAESLTLVRNPEGMLPIRDIDTLSLASLAIGVNRLTPFQDRLDDYAPVEHQLAPKEMNADQRGRLIDKLAQHNVVVVSLHGMTPYARSQYGVSNATLRLLDDLRKRTRVVLVVFGNPYSLGLFDDIDWVLEAYEENETTQDLAAQALFGVFGVRGRLPVTASAQSPFNAGVTTEKTFRLGYAAPDEVGLLGDSLLRIKELAERAIELRATPGCVVLVAKNGEIVFEDGFGYHTYNKERPVTPEDIYDLASITKILASTLSVMKLVEEGRLDLDAPIGNYLEELRGSDKAGLTLRDIMAHHAGLQPWIPFYRETVTQSRRNPQPMATYYRNAASGHYSVPVARNLFLRDDYQEKILEQIRDSELRRNRNYRYSDLGFYLIRFIVERISGETLDEYVVRHFYRPLGLRNIGFKPWQHFPIDHVVPTEEDRYFRRQRIQGYVHDSGAAMLGGISGHAGLFSNARDMAVIMQMLIQGGHYGGKRFLAESTVREFTTRHPRSTRRALGFDMYQLNPAHDPNLSPLASKNTFGHTGFTGTCVWADPDNQVIYIFLSNRTYPRQNNNKLNKMEIRPRIQSVVYGAMEGPRRSAMPLALPDYPSVRPLPWRSRRALVPSRATRSDIP